MAGESLVHRALAKLGVAVLEQRGPRLWAACPFHSEAEASWMIRWRGARRGQHYCFGCKRGGHLVDLVMHLKGYGTRDGAEGWLERLGPDDAPAVALGSVRLQVGSPTRRGFRMPGEVIEEPYDLWPSVVQRYASDPHPRGRGIPRWQVDRWRLAYAVGGRLEGRLVIPVRDARGTLASYMARAMGDAGKRYLTPHESERANLDVMFGEEHWTPPCDRTTAVVTEGGFKSLAVERVLFAQSYPAAIATLGGSGVRPMHLAKLATFREVVVFTDNDSAGQDAAAEIAAGLARHTRVSRVTLPPKSDADSVEPEAVWKVLCERQVLSDPSSRSSTSATPRS